MAFNNVKRAFLKELLTFFKKKVVVRTVQGRLYKGDLKAFDPDLLACLISNATTEDKETGERITYPKIFINGSQIAEIFLEETQFDLKGLAEELEKVFRRPGDIEIHEEANFITVLGRTKVSEKGVEGTGPVAERVNNIYEGFLRTSVDEEEPLE